MKWTHPYLLQQYAFYAPGVDVRHVPTWMERERELYRDWKHIPFEGRDQRWETLSLSRTDPATCKSRIQMGSFKSISPDSLSVVLSFLQGTDACPLFFTCKGLYGMLSNHIIQTTVASKVPSEKCPPFVNPVLYGFIHDGKRCTMCLERVIDPLYSQGRYEGRRRRYGSVSRKPDYLQLCGKCCDLYIPNQTVTSVERKKEWRITRPDNKQFKEFGYKKVPLWIVRELSYHRYGGPEGLEIYREKMNVRAEKAKKTLKTNRAKKAEERREVIETCLENAKMIMKREKKKKEMTKEERKEREREIVETKYDELYSSLEDKYFCSLSLKDKINVYGKALEALLYPERVMELEEMKQNEREDEREDGEGENDSEESEEEEEGEEDE